MGCKPQVQSHSRCPHLQVRFRAAAWLGPSWYPDDVVGWQCSLVLPVVLRRLARFDSVHSGRTKYLVFERSVMLEVVHRSILCSLLSWSSRIIRMADEIVS